MPSLQPLDETALAVHCGGFDPMNEPPLNKRADLEEMWAKLLVQQPQTVELAGPTPYDAYGFVV